eukprot:883506-Amphidinium_carterae.1
MKQYMLAETSFKGVDNTCPSNMTTKRIHQIQSGGNGAKWVSYMSKPSEGREECRRYSGCDLKLNPSGLSTLSLCY